MKYILFTLLGFSSCLLADQQSKLQHEPRFSKGEGPGWIELTENDFVNINCKKNTWKWEGGHAFCTGQPIGVIRSQHQFKNFELSLEWMHKKPAGNSGVFIWTTPESIDFLLKNPKTRLPKGIEVQILDPDYGEQYLKKNKKKADWFTCHGDVFPVGVKMSPFPPTSADGSRSFPTEERTLGINQWNHYYIRAIDGVVRLWVNGKEVSGGYNIEPSQGYISLESEGSPIEFKNIRLRILPPIKK